MKDASYLIRKEVYDALNGNITINSSNLPVYNVVPSTQNGYPYLGINQISQLLISRNTFFNLSSSDFKVISAENNGINYITEDTDTKTFYRGILTYSNLVEQL